MAPSVAEEKANSGSLSEKVSITSNRIAIKRCIKRKSNSEIVSTYQTFFIWLTRRRMFELEFLLLRQPRDPLALDRCVSASLGAPEARQKPIVVDTLVHGGLTPQEINQAVRAQAAADGSLYFVDLPR